MGMKRRRPVVAAVVIIVLAATVGIIATRRNNESKITIKTAKVERGDVTTSVSGTGTLEALTTVEVKSNVGGQLVYLGVDEGDTVKAGQVIARIDPSDAQSALGQSQANLESANAQVTQAQEGLSLQRVQNDAQLRSAEQAVTVATLKLAQAQKEADLQEKQTMTSIEQAQQSYAAATARRKQAEQQARVQPQLTNTAIAQAEASLATAKASLQQVKTASVPQKLASAQTALDQAKANFSYAEKNLARQRALQAKGYVSKNEVDTAEQSYAVAKAALDSAQNKFDTVKDETNEDIASAQAKVTQAEAALHSAQASRVDDDIRQQDLASAIASENQAKAALQAAKDNAAQVSLKQDAVKTAQAELVQAKASQDQAKANSFQIPIKQGDITQAQASVKSRQAEVTNAFTQLGYTTITAPRSGIVVKRYVEAGTVVAGGKSNMSSAGNGVTLMDIADVSRMRAVVNIDETDIAQIRVNQEVDVTVDAYPNELFFGKVIKIAPMTSTTDNVTTIPVTVEIQSPDLRLKPGMNATCDFVTERHKDVLTVPNAAVKQGDNGSVVMVVEHGKPTPHPVTVGLSDNDKIEIVDGLQEGDVVVTAVHDPKQDAANNSSQQGAGGTNRGMGGGMRRMGPM